MKCNEQGGVMKKSGEVPTSWHIRIVQVFFALLLTAGGGGLCWFGAQLVTVGGSPYYLVAGLLVLGAAFYLWRGDRRGAWLYGLMLAGTWLWALWEVGFDGWALLPRVLVPTVLGLWLLTPWAFAPGDGEIRRSWRMLRAGAVVLLLGMLGVATMWWEAVDTPSIAATATTTSALVTEASADTAAGEWHHYGRDAGGTRFSPLDQITPANVADLQPAWSMRTGYASNGAPAPFEATPLKVGDTLYFCTPANDVFALDAQSGATKWHFRAQTDEHRVGFKVCRGVAYYRDPAGDKGACSERIITATIDARLLAMDAHTGEPCSSFGKNGAVDLRQGMGTVDKGYYYTTSAPQVIRGKVVFGGWVSDNQHIGEPSGVIRAFDAVTGKFAWAFDMGRPDVHAEPGPGEQYTAGTPNSWAPISADEALGLVYLPTGNSVPDWYGGQRRPFDERYGSSVLALDAETGALRWSFQTTHHDLWDFDVASQPTLYDMLVNGQRVPALILPTKRAEIFVLDRRTGKPLTAVEERTVPTSTVPGERAAPTQPFSVGMPSLAGSPLTEKMMWGLTPLDQAWCRLAFKKSVYEGPMTPPAINQPTIAYPGYMGGIDWGSVAVDRDRDILIANSSRLAMRAMLIPRAEADQLGIKPIAEGVHGNVGAASAQAGTPYAVSITPFMSPLDVPCQQPPYGVLSAIDMKTQKLLWEQPLGSGRDSGPLGIPSMLPLRMGVPNTGGALVTRGGVTFLSATQDNYLRAFETKTGRLLWKTRLPAGGQATPMTYLSPAGRQVVVLSAGGHAVLRSKTGDHVVAFALPEEAGRAMPAAAGR